jgi:mannosyltransferase
LPAVSVGSLAHTGARRARLGREGVWRRAVADRTVPAVAGLTALAAVLRFYRLAHQGFWFDEGSTALLVHFSPGNMLGLIPQSESTPPLYYMVAWVWARVFGFGEAGLRSLSALAGVMVVPVAYGIGDKLCTRRVGVVLAALTACSPLLIWYSQEARSYELLVLLTALSLLAFAHARANPRPPLLTGWCILSALALATHYYAVLAIIPEAIALLLAHRRDRAVRIAVTVVMLCGAALIPLAVAQNATGHDDWIATTALGLRLRQVIPQFLIGTGIPAHALLEPLAAVIAAAGIFAVFARAQARERSGALLAGALAIGGLVLNLILIVFGVDDLITRNIVALWLPAALLVAGGLGARRVGVLGVLATVAMCGIGVTAALGVDFDRNLERPDWRAVARAMGPLPDAGRQARAILIQHYRTLLPLSLYEPRLAFLRHGSARVSDLDVISMRSPEQSLCWWGAACNLIPSQMQSSYPVPGFHLDWRRHVHQFTILAMSAERPVVLTPAAVSSALYTTHLRHDELLVQRPTSRS